MKKEVLLVWFGDNEPLYAKWNVENFKKMNPGWDVSYVNCTLEQLKQRKSSDAVLDEAIQEYKSKMSQFTDKGFSKFSIYYRRAYILSAKHPVVYCDLDCFPIAPLDEFFQVDTFKEGMCFSYGSVSSKHSCYNFSMKKQSEPAFDCMAYSDSVPCHTRSDCWCLSNIQCTRSPLVQIYEGTDLEKPLTQECSWIFNADQNSQKIFNIRKWKFEECELSAGDNACCKFFSPVEHYYCRERTKDCYDINSCTRL